MISDLGTYEHMTVTRFPAQGIDTVYVVIFVNIRFVTSVSHGFSDSHIYAKTIVSLTSVHLRYQWFNTRL